MKYPWHREGRYILLAIMLFSALLLSIQTTYQPDQPFDTWSFHNRLYAIRYTLLFPVWFAVRTVGTLQIKNFHNTSNTIYILSLIATLGYYYLITDLLFPVKGWTSYPPLSQLTLQNNHIDASNHMMLDASAHIIPLLLILYGFIFCFRWGYWSAGSKTPTISPTPE